jgi:hypothetical protein
MSIQSRTRSGLQATVRSGLQSITDAGGVVVESDWYLSRIPVDSSVSSTTLNGAITNSDLNMNVPPGSLLPNSATPYFVKIFDGTFTEVVRVTGVSPQGGFDALTIERGREGTEAASWPGGTPVRLRFDYTADYKEPLTDLLTSPVGPTIIWSDDDIVLIQNRTVTLVSGETYSTVHNIYCHDATDGDLLWVQQFPIAIENPSLISRPSDGYGATQAWRSGEEIAVIQYSTVTNLAPPLDISVALFDVSDGSVLWSVDVTSYIESIIEGLPIPRFYPMIMDSESVRIGLCSGLFESSNNAYIFRVSRASGSLSFSSTLLPTKISSFFGSRAVPAHFLSDGKLLLLKNKAAIADSRTYSWYLVSETGVTFNTGPDLQLESGGPHAQYSSAHYLATGLDTRRYDNDMALLASTSGARLARVANEAGWLEGLAFFQHDFTPVFFPLVRNIDENEDYRVAVLVRSVWIDDSRNYFALTPNYARIRNALT